MKVFVCIVLIMQIALFARGCSLVNEGKIGSGVFSIVLNFVFGCMNVATLFTH